MRQVRNPQMKLGEVRIEDIELDLRSRDDIPALLLGLQHLYADGHFRSRLFALLEEHILPGTDRTAGRPGMEMWERRANWRWGSRCKSGRKERLTTTFTASRAGASARVRAKRRQRRVWPG